MFECLLPNCSLDALLNLNKSYHIDCCFWIINIYKTLGNYFMLLKYLHTIYIKCSSCWLWFKAFMEVIEKYILLNTFYHLSFHNCLSNCVHQGVELIPADAGWRELHILGQVELAQLGQEFDSNMHVFGLWGKLTQALNIVTCLKHKANLSILYL